jgi:hypothetical protein
MCNQKYRAGIKVTEIKVTDMSLSQQRKCDTGPSSEPAETSCLPQMCSLGYEWTFDFVSARMGLFGGDREPNERIL